MDPVTSFIRSWKLPVGPWGKSFIDFIITYFQWFFDALKVALNFAVDWTTAGLLAIPPVLLALLIAGFAYWLQKSWKLALGVFIGLVFIINQGLWKETVQTLVLVVGATALSMAMGVPLGIWAAHKARVWRVTQPILDLMQTMPTFVYLIPILILFVSHDLEEALKIGNRITIMEGGRIVQSGTPEDIVLKPANDYVRDFIANVNPLSVLTAWNVMRALPELERGEDGWVWLDTRKTTRFKLGADGKVVAAERDGHPATWVSCDHVETPVDPGHRPVFWARPGTTLKVVMLAIHNTDVAPVAIFNENDKFLGSISVRHVLRAVLKRQD